MELDLVLRRSVAFGSHYGFAWDTSFQCPGQIRVHLCCTWWSLVYMLPKQGFFTVKLLDFLASRFFVGGVTSELCSAAAIAEDLQNAAWLQFKRSENTTTTSSLLWVNSSCKCHGAMCTGMLPRYMLEYLNITSVSMKRRRHNFEFCCIIQTEIKQFMVFESIFSLSRVHVSNQKSCLFSFCMEGRGSGTF